jgi:rhodanese-related sulfurtransferase
MKRVLFSIAAGVLSFAGVSVFSANHTTDSTAEVKKALEENKAVLIDVREADEWKDGHLKSAYHLPLSEIKAGVSKEKLQKLIPAGKIVYLHCAAGGRCLRAAEALRSAGYDVRPLKPGYSELVQAGFDTAK